MAKVAGFDSNLCTFKPLKVEMKEGGGGVKRDMRKAGEEEDWKKKTGDRVGWKRL